MRHKLALSSFYYRLCLGFLHKRFTVLADYSTAGLSAELLSVKKGSAQVQYTQILYYFWLKLEFWLKADTTGWL